MRGLKQAYLMTSGQDHQTKICGSTEKQERNESPASDFPFSKSSIILEVQYFLGCRCAHQMTPQPTPVQGQGHTSANFSASLELTLRDIRSSYISATIQYMYRHQYANVEFYQMRKYVKQLCISRAYHIQKISCSLHLHINNTLMSENESRHWKKKINGA